MTIKYLRYNYAFALFQNLQQELARCEYQMKEKPGDIEWMARKEKITHDLGLIQKYLHKLSKEMNLELEDQVGCFFKFVINHEKK